MNFIESPKKLFAVALSVILFLGTGCNKDDDGPAATGYPRSVTIQYKVTGTGFTQAAQLTYTNEAGGATTANNVPLPFTKTITRNVNRYDDVALLFSNTGVGTLTGEISVDNVVKIAVPFSSTSATAPVAGSAIYIFQ